MAMWFPAGVTPGVNNVTMHPVPCMRLASATLTKVGGTADEINIGMDEEAADLL